MHSLKHFFVALLLLLFSAVSAHAQEIRLHIHSPGQVDSVLSYRAPDIDSIQFMSCDSNLDYEGCDAEIDTVIEEIVCGNMVTLKAVLEGTPNDISWHVYDSSQTMIFSASGTSTVSFTLPGQGVYLYTLDVGCGGGDRAGGDADSYSHELINFAPVADFTLSTKSTCINGVPKHTVSILNSSTGDNLNYSWVVQEPGGSQYLSGEPSPVFQTNPVFWKNIALTVTDKNGCQSIKKVTVNEVDTGCTAAFGYGYQWCDTTVKDVEVNFTNSSTFNDCPMYTWDFGDNSATSSLENPTHQYHITGNGGTFTVKLLLVAGSSTSTLSKTIRIRPFKPDLTIHKCNDGRVDFYTHAKKGKWTSSNTVKNPALWWVGDNIHEVIIAGVSLGIWNQHYWQYLDEGDYHILLEATSDDSNTCTIDSLFHVEPPVCLARNDKVVPPDFEFGGHMVHLKFSQQAYPAWHTIIGKIKFRNWWKFQKATVSIDGNLFKLGSEGCFDESSSVTNAGDAYPSNPATTENKRKCKVRINRIGRFRSATDQLTATFEAWAKDGSHSSWQLKLSNDCDKPWLPLLY